MHRRSPVGTPRRQSDSSTRLAALALLVAAFCTASWLTGALGATGTAASGGSLATAAPVAGIAAAGPVELRQAVFPPTVRLMPGERRTATVEVRNAKTTPAHALVRLRARGIAPLLRDGVLDVESRVPGAAWKRLGDRPPYDVARIESLPAGATVPVRFRARLRPDAVAEPLTSEDLALRIVLARAYTQEELAELNAARPDPQLELVPLFLGLGMATAGALVLALRSRRHRRARRRWL